jgi:hypothetical protein
MATATGEKGNGGSGIATTMVGVDDKAGVAGADDKTDGFCFLVGFIAAEDPGFTAVFAKTGTDFGATGPSLSLASSAN